MACLTAAGTSLAQSLPAPVANALSGTGVPVTAVALWSQPIGTTRTRLAVNASKPMNPASTIKLLTTYAALDLLGPAHTWKTEVWTTAEPKGDVLPGNLVLRGGGDPSLTIEHLWRLVQAVRAKGIREVRGDVIADRSYFDVAEHDPSRFDSEPLRPYNVGPDALLVNFKAFRFTFVPEPERRVARIIVEPRSTLLEFSPSVDLGGEPCNDWRRGLRAAFSTGAPSRAARASFAGTFPASCGERTMNVALMSPSDYLKGVFTALWEDSGGILTGGWQDGPVPAGSRLVHTHESPSLAEVVRDINKFSNNVMARQLFLGLSSEVDRVPGRTDLSAAIIRKWLESRNLSMPELVIDNGSGLSRRESISAESLGRLLVSAFASPVMPEFVSSLPLLAVDGTLRRRQRAGSMAGQAHIKTGSLADVRSIAGYVLDRNGHRHAMVMIVNHPNASATQAAQDAFIRWLYESGG